MHIPAGAFNRASDNQPNFEFNCTFCYAITPLQVTTTNPPVNGTFSPPAPGDYQYDVNWNQAVDPSSVTVSDLTLTGNAGGSVTNVQLINGNMTTRFTLHFNFGGSVTASIAAGAITAHTCNGNAAFTGNYTVLGCPPQDHYAIAQIGGSIVPGTTDTGNHGDDQVTTISIPFSYSLYDQTYTSVNVSSNGNAQFTTTDINWVNSCPLPWTSHNYTVFPYWDDQRTDAQPGCAGFPGGTCGIFTSVSGVFPNRIFNIEWRTVYFANTSQTPNPELRLYEGQSRFDVIYGTVALGNSSATAGVQKNDTAFDQYFCDGSGGAATGGQSYQLQNCAPMAQDAFSRKVHGGAGTFDIPLPLTGNVGVECRSGGATNAYQMIIDFATTVTVESASVTSGTGMVSSFSGSGTSQITVNLTGVTNVQRITMTLHNVNDGTHMGDVPISMGVLIGDVNGNAVVNASDVSLTKSQVGNPVISSNFREDVNANGTISATDVALVKSDVGTALPP